MRWAYRIGRVAGTDIKVHVTFLLLLLYVAASAYSTGGRGEMVATLGYILALFACVLFHEFGHILMARHFGVSTPDVILLPIGGVARLQRIPEEPRQEFLIALAGPLVTLLIVLVLAAVLIAQGSSPTAAFSDADGTSFVGAIMALNVWLLGFNLLPAFPMDGGRVLRAFLSARLGLARATQIAGRVGQLLALGMATYGFLHHPPMYLLVLVAFFVLFGAGSEMAMVQSRTVGRGLQVSEMMVTEFRTIPIFAKLAQASELLLSGEQREFPVVDNLGRVEGILTREGLLRGLAARGPESTVSEAMTARAPTVPPTLGFEQALATLRASGLPALAVVDAAGALVGLLTAENISELLMVRRAQGR